MNMVELAANTIRDIENQMDEPCTDTIISQREAITNLNRALSRLDDETANELDAKIEYLREQDAIIAYTEGFQRGIQFMTTALTANSKKY